MTVRRGTVRADGTSTLVRGGIYDMSLESDDLSPELEAKVKALVDKIDLRETSAQYKLEVFFRGGPRRSVPVRGVVACWTNGGYLSGGGDAAVYLCPQDVGGAPCSAPLDMQFAAGGQVVCTRCRRISSTDALIGQIVIDVPLQRWAQILVKLFHTLECSADIRICIERGSIRDAAAKELASYQGGEKYAAVMNQREWLTYPLTNIIKDTASGAGLESRFRAFLEA